jgi:hypothetical protein
MVATRAPTENRVANCPNRLILISLLESIVRRRVYYSVGEKSGQRATVAKE